MNITDTADLRAFLLLRMQNLVLGTETIQATTAIAAIAKQVNQTLILEQQAQRIIAENKTIKAIQM